MDAAWESLFHDWHASPRSAENGNRHQRLEKEARKLLSSKEADLSWVLRALDTAGSSKQTREEASRVYFVSSIWQRQGQIPKRMFEPLIRAGVYERNPGSNRYYIEPCLRSFGPLRVVNRLIEFFETGTNYEKAGANNALYWALGHANRYLPEESTADKEALDRIRERLRVLRLREFVSNSDLDVRRSLIPSLDLKTLSYPPEVAPLVEEAVRIARAHPDDYIRHRVEIQLGSGGPYFPLPHRNQAE